MDVDVATLKNVDNGSLQIISEGKVKIAIGEGAQTFYNPVQEFNRDLTVLILQQFVYDRKQLISVNNGEEIPKAKRVKIDLSKPFDKIQILDALSASGLRALRFSKEVPDVDFVVANDFSEDAVEAIRKNVKMNGLEDLVKPSFRNAIDVMMEHRTFNKRFHVIDLDPYGSAANFLDSAVQSVADKGILMVTCTDTATLCGNTPEACFNKYGSIPLRHCSCHEFALRILLKCMDSHANRHGRYIKPLLSVSIDFYVRVFVQVFTSASKAKDSVTKLSNVLACTSCRSLEFQPLLRKTINGSSVRFSNATIQTLLLAPHQENKKNSTIKLKEELPKNETSLHIGPKSQCSYCGVGPIHLAGPIYTDPLHDLEFVERLLNRLKDTPEGERFGTHNRLTGMLTVVSEEVNEVPLYYESDQIMNVVRCSVPKHVIVRSAIINAGYKCSISHCNPKALKTNAPNSFLWDICRAWAKINSVDFVKMKDHPVAHNILSAKSESEVCFSLNSLAMPKSKLNCLLRFPDNKGKNWGPKCKAKGSITSATAQYMVFFFKLIVFILLGYWISC